MTTTHERQPHWTILSGAKLLTTIVAAVLFASAASGCKQSTDTISDQETTALTSAYLATANQQARDGATVVFNFVTDPEGHYKGDRYGLRDESNPDPEATADANGPARTIATDAVTADRSITVTVGNITVNDGSTGLESGQTGSADGASTGTQTPTVTATQDVKAEVVAELALAFAPGGIADSANQGTASGGDGSAVFDKQDQRELTSLLQGGKVTPDQLNKILPGLLELLDRRNDQADAATTQPVEP